MPEQELWLTALLNQLFGKSVTSFLEAIGIHPASPSHPIPNHFAMELVVALIIVVLLGRLRSRLSVDRPGGLQQVFELTLDGLGSQTDEIVGHAGRRFLPLLFTLGLFILLCNVLGEIPHLATPTGVIYVTVGCALVSLLYYHAHGIRHHGVLGYLKTFLGPMPTMGAVAVILGGWLMFLIEIVSHLARGLSLSVRLFANMLAGEKITEIIFERILGLGAPVIFMALHIFVGLIQAYIFVLLTMIYLGGAVSEEH